MALGIAREVGLPTAGSSVRIDAADASALCQTVAGQVEVWRIRVADPR